MPTHRTRYEGSFYSENGTFNIVRIYDKNHTGSKIPINIADLKIKYDTKGQEKFSPIIASKCSISLIVEDNVFGTHVSNFLKRLRETYEEGDVTIVIWNTPDTQGLPLWSGNVLIDLSTKEDVSRPYEVELNATDGIGLLKNYDMVETQGSAPYSSGDTYISDGYQTFIYWIKTILEYCNTPDWNKTDGDVGDYTFSTAVDWWYEDHPAASQSKSPLAYTQCQMLGSYTLTEAGLYKVKSVYDVLESFCKLWGMRVVFWRNTFWFTQIELYNTADAGTYANPENVDTQTWTKAGAASNSFDYLGSSWFSLYSQDIEPNIGGFRGALQKLAGSKWDYYPKLKEVIVDFENISNNNYFTAFPQPTTDGDGTYPASYGYDLIESTPLGVHTGAAAFGGFNVLFILDFNNPGGAIDWRNNATIRARPDGDTGWDNGYYFDPDTTTWETYPQENPPTVPAANVWVADPVINAGYNNTGNSFQNEPAVTMFTLPSGTSQHTVYSGQIPTHAAFTGDWEFEIFNLATVFGISGWTPAYFWRHAGGDMAAGYNYNISVTENISYSDPLDASGSPLSQFNPILSSLIGGSINTIVYSARNETQSQAVKDIWWGDTLTYGEPASLIWDDGAGGSGYTDPLGLWRNGQSGTFNKSIIELLCEARLLNQQQSDYKWSLQTAVSETNSWLTDGTGWRPVYVNPVGRIHDTIDQIFYYLLRGTFNLLKDEWDGEWLQVSYSTDTATTTTTSTTGGTNPGANTSGAKLSSPSTSSLNGFLTIGAIRTRIAAGTTITSVDIQIMNPLANEAEESPPIRMFNQTTLIKAGDIINLSANGSNGQVGRFQQFEASADVEDGDNTMSVTSIKTTRALEVGDHITVNLRDSYQQLNHKTRGTIGGMPVDADDLGPINYDTGVYSITGVDPTYVKILARDFMVNDDVGSPTDTTPAVFNDGTNTGVSVEDTDQELIATVNIPYGTTATLVTIWASNTTKVVEVYEMDINANGKGSAIGTGTTNGSAIDITDTAATTTNYLMIKVLVSSTNHRVWGGTVTLTQN